MRWMCKIVGCLAAALVAAALTVSPAGADERILAYDVRVEVGADAALDVTETIRVRAERNQIRRGIFRDFPIRYLEPPGTWRYVGFDLQEVLRDGQAEPYHTEYLGNILRIYVGEAETFLRDGEYTYTIRYRTTRQLRYFDDFDELYWNVTGNFWVFPIDRATATIVLPAAARILQKAAYTGPSGSSGSDYAITAEDAGTITFESTRPFRAYEGLTVAVAFPKGFAWQPGSLVKALWYLWDNLGLGVLFVGAISVAAYFLTTWQRVGRDPQRGVIIPLYEPPRGFSPGAVSYLHFWGLKSGRRGTALAFVAALMALAVKKRIRIDEDEDDDDTIGVERTAGGSRSVSPGEQAIESALFRSGRDRVTFEKAYATTIASAQSKFAAAINREYRDKFFRDNRVQFAVGAALSIATIVAFAIVHRPLDTQVVLLFPTFLSALVGTSLLFFGLGWLLRWMPGGRSRWLGALMVPLGAVALVPALLLPLAASGTLPALAVIAFGALPVMCVLFFHLLRAPTIAGRKVMDDIEGFKLYLTVAESERMNLADAPDMSTELFERYLPYAIGLSVEKPWSRALEAHLARVAPEDAGRTYHPSWYHGSSWDSSRLDAATAGLASAIAGSVASSMPSSSGSGSGGGGSSGGGGGGGGGGGW